ncbi:hypothetical protein LZ30DRAFT_377641 [Colletotrichum cereale]|nr:hypothetical protein LZ30DRAFT_377641 [Colletotrichum cereale]
MHNSHLSRRSACPTSRVAGTACRIPIGAHHFNHVSGLVGLMTRDYSGCVPPARLASMTRWVDDNLSASSTRVRFRFLVGAGTEWRGQTFSGSLGWAGSSPHVTYFCIQYGLACRSKQSQVRRFVVHLRTASCNPGRTSPVTSQSVSSIPITLLSRE